MGMGMIVSVGMRGSRGGAAALGGQHDLRLGDALDREQGRLGRVADLGVEEGVLSGHLHHEADPAGPDGQALHYAGGDQPLAGAGVDHPVYRGQDGGAAGDGGGGRLSFVGHGEGLTPCTSNGTASYPLRSAG
jgi:hypothetical protein